MALGSLRDLDDKTLTDLVRNPLTYLALSSPFWGQDRERWPLYVIYDGEKAKFIPRDHFYLGRFEEGPSDCTWIIPGSTS